MSRPGQGVLRGPAALCYAFLLLLLLLSALPTAGNDIALPALSAADAQRLQAPENGPFLIAFGRDIALSDRAVNACGVITVASPRAVALRLALRFEELPDDARLQFSAVGGRQAHVITAAEVHVDAGNGMYWAPTVRGDEISVDIQTPAGAGSTEVGVELLRVAHY